VFQPWCGAHGFRRTKSRMVGWFREFEPESRKHRFPCFWFQVSSWSDQFTAEFQLSHEPRISVYGRERMGRILSEAQRHRVLARGAQIQQKTSGESIADWERNGRSDLWLREL